MERRRIIGTVLLALAGVIFLVSNVWFIIKMPMGGEKIADLLTRTLPELLALLAVGYTFVRPGKTLKLKLDIRERRLKMDEHYAIDPYGYGYIMMGGISVAVTIAFAIDIMGALSVPPFDKVPAGWCIVVISAITVAVVIWMSIKIVKAQTRAKNS
jgi:hypothetical protein